MKRKSQRGEKRKEIIKKTLQFQEVFPQERLNDLKEIQG